LQQWASEVGRKGPSCGWVLAFAETLLAEYHIPWRDVWSQFPVLLGFELSKARRERHGADSEISEIDTSGLRAMKAERQRLEAEYRIIEPSAAKAPQ